MTAATVRKCAVREILESAELPALRQEFADEVATFAAPAPISDMVGYVEMEAVGSLQMFGAFLGERLVGFVGVIVHRIPRCSVSVAVTDGMYVGRAYRNTGAGMKLIRAAEVHAAEAGSPRLMVGTPSDGPLVSILPRLGYAETNRVFSKDVTCHG